MNEVSQDSSSPTEENYNRSNESMQKKESQENSVAKN